MKILITAPVADAGINILRQHAEVVIEQISTPEQLQSIIGQYVALIVRSQTKVTADVIAAADNTNNFFAVYLCCVVIQRSY